MISLVNKYYFFKIMSLKINDKLPLFTLKNQYNLEVNSKELYGQNVVIFFIQKTILLAVQLKYVTLGIILIL